MAVPAHDPRDYEFATNFGLPIQIVVSPGEGQDWDGVKAYTGPGVMVNSTYHASNIDLNGLPNGEAAKQVTDWITNLGFGRKQVHSMLDAVGCVLCNAVEDLLPV